MLKGDSLLEELRRVAIVTSGVAELTRNKAERVVRDLVKAGDVRKDQTSVLVKELLRRSAENRKELTSFVRSEIKHQIEGLGLASKRDVERLERRVLRLEAGGKKTSASGSSKSSKTSKKSASAGKSTSRKSSAKKNSARKTAKPGPNSTPSAKSQG